ncbi:MAG: aminodeoxychorismate lyase [Aliidiomarina sp.]|uniref:aminodeoxychorismate lyase n=1 Tax=Aliidiomarina sp. TaxID=1872439 RepID=UPI0025B90DFC|nr:aminodeoxychorismate lyase [Aliidiomarina sp.]MCH8500319.1 aminodeoxychorismate lyase [Aliidiomarina sp.]
MTKQNLPIQSVDGNITDTLALTDRSWQFADGCFTTIAMSQGQLQLWPLHWSRLQQCAQRLGLGQISESEIIADWEELRQSLAPEYLTKAVVKIVLTRGDGGRGYTPPASTIVRRILTVSEFPSHYEAWQEEGIAMGRAQLKLGRQPALAGLKTLNRLEQVLLKQELAQDETLDDLVVFDSDDYIVEATAANLFWRQGDKWYTPALDQAGVAGVAREQLLKVNPQVKIGHYRWQSLQQADELLICNALMGLVPVRQLDGKPLAQCRHYPQQLQSVLQP